MCADQLWSGTRRALTAQGADPPNPAQGQRLLAYGGERALPAGAARGTGGDADADGDEDEEDDTETVGDAALLDAGAQLWVPLALAGAR